MVDSAASSEPEDLAGLGRVLYAESSLEELLQHVVSLARHTVPAADGVTVSLHDDSGGYKTPTTTDDLVYELDQVQYRFDEGPCVEALKTNRPVSFRVDEGDPYPRFAEAAASKFVSAVMSTPMSVGGKGIGALNMYSGTVPAFPKEQMETAQMFAEQAAVVLANGLAYDNSTTLNVRLQEALLSRDVIGQAKGLIMAQEGCGSEEAFGRLRLQSQRENRKLRTIAQEIVDAHDQSRPS